VELIGRFWPSRSTPGFTFNRISLLFFSGVFYAAGLKALTALAYSFERLRAKRKRTPFQVLTLSGTDLSAFDTGSHLG
jgi:hypothetical protein